MKLYFARHGETDSNLQRRVVGFNDQLTHNGRLQAQRLAERLAKEQIELVIASPHLRTRETAGIVAKKINLGVQEISLLGEKKWPGAIEGKPLTDTEVGIIFDLMKNKNNSDPTWHHSDEENFLDTKLRAKLFIDYISKSTCANILAVSHEYLIKIVIATMMHGDRLSYDIFRDFFHFTSLGNSSLTLCEKENGIWKLITLNEL